MRTVVAAGLCLGFALAAGAAGAAEAVRKGSIHGDVPAAIDRGARHLFYLHGRILEIQGRHAVSPDFGAYQYDAILEALAERGFVVISEVRQGDAGVEFARKVAGQIRSLLRAGVRPEDVTVVGASKGGALALMTSAELGEERVGFVVLAGCSAGSKALAPRLKGRILSIYDARDRFNPSCRETFALAPQLDAKKEVVLELGLDHGLLYAPRREWLALVSEWAADRRR